VPVGTLLYDSDGLEKTTSGIVECQTIVIWFLKIATNKLLSSPESSLSLQIAVK